MLDMFETYEPFILKCDSNGNFFLPYAVIEFETEKDFEEFKSIMDRANVNYRPTLKKAIAKYGEYAQLDMVIEEMAELTQAISKFKRNESHNVEEEVADVEIMLQQVRLMSIFNAKKIDEIKEQKLKKLEGIVC